MSLQEIEEEFRQTEGDPTVKGKLRQLRATRMRKRIIAAVPKASVVITNPTHYAIALKYERGMNAPVCVAKGVDLIARKIREVAEEHRVPVVENPPLARALHATVEIDQEIPQEHYRAVAEIIGYIMRLRRMASDACPRNGPGIREKIMLRGRSERDNESIHSPRALAAAAIGRAKHGGWARAARKAHEAHGFLRPSGSRRATGAGGDGMTTTHGMAQDHPTLQTAGARKSVDRSTGGGRTGSVILVLLVAALLGRRGRRRRGAWGGEAPIPIFLSFSRCWRRSASFRCSRSPPAFCACRRRGRSIR